jgi:hypothetical protein
MVHIHIVYCQKGYKVFVATIISCAKHACVHTFYVQELRNGNRKVSKSLRHRLEAAAKNSCPKDLFCISHMYILYSHIYH